MSTDQRGGAFWRRLSFSLPITALVLGGACGGDGGRSPAPAPSIPPPPPPAANRAPTAVGTIPEQVLTLGGDPTIVNVADAFSDPDGDTLSYSASSSNREVIQVTVSGSEATLTSAAEGTAAVTITASDPAGLSATQTFLAHVRPSGTPNRAPTATGAIPDQTMNQGASPTTLDVAGVFSDPDGDPLTYSASSNDTGVVQVTVAGSVLTLTPVGQGMTAITITARDPGGLSTAQTVPVLVRPPDAPNEPPRSVRGIPDQVLHQGDDPTVLDLTHNFSEPEGEPLTYAADSDDPRIVEAAISGTTLVLTPGDTGTTRVRVTAHDPAGLSAFQLVDVTVRLAIGHTYRTGEKIHTLPAGFWIPDFNHGATYQFSNLVSIRLEPQGFVEEDGIRYTCFATRTCVISRLTVVAGAITTTKAEHTGANHQPIATARGPVGIPEQSLTAGGTTTLNASEYFLDPNSDPMTYTVGTSNPAVVTAAVSGETVTITAVAAGTATVTVTASDPGGLSATQTAQVQVR